MVDPTAAADLLTQIAATGADLLVRTKNGRQLPVVRRLSDASWISRIGALEVRVLRLHVVIETTQGRRSEVYQLITTVTDPGVCVLDLARLYHQRWEIETAYLELKSTLAHGRVLRARTPGGVAQEVYALLITYQALRIAITDATGGDPERDPDRASFTIALHTARDQIVLAAGIIDASGDDLIGVIGAAVLAQPLPPRRSRISPRVVKRAISNYAPNTTKGRLRGPTYQATISIEILHQTPLTPTATG